MIEHEWEVPTSDGKMRTFAAYPDRGQPRPLALLCQDGPGYREDLKDVARRFATDGYCCVIPDWTYRFGPPLDLAHPSAREEVRRRMAGLLSAPQDTIVSDAGAVLDFIDAKGVANTRQVVASGYCYGASCIIHLMAAFPDRMSAGAGWHPYWLGDNDEILPMHERGAPEPADGVGKVPARLTRAFDNIHGALYFGVAEIDQWVSQADFRQLGSEMRAHGVHGEVEVHAGATHGFTVPGGPTYQKAGSERHFERTLELWRRNLT
jgi:carboxymethylenebutenolidase